jgi:hypothetical protein
MIEKRFIRYRTFSYPPSLVTIFKSAFLLTVKHIYENHSQPSLVQAFRLGKLWRAGWTTVSERSSIRSEDGTEGENLF